eukprot:TRINITY_DN41501_c0_g1_i1.p1 TRINITY_DN41501_c0_g1~~TRINITY_DN41501_c0_g1_i1.p1  ORF type:complete len:1081 (+),score=199.95 TRINITY_DN41501_c0_g1_i1:66-3308(+)
MSAMATWKLKADIEVLYTRQKAAKRPRFKEGTLRLRGGLAELLDAAGRELDGQTVTQPWLEHLRSGEDVEFPGHLVQLVGPVASALLGASDAELSRSSHETTSLVAQPSTAAAQKAKPFKRPRLAAEPPLVFAPFEQLSAVSMSALQPALPCHVDLWEACVREDATVGCTEDDALAATAAAASLPDSTQRQPQDLWALCCDDLAGEDLQADAVADIACSAGYVPTAAQSDRAASVEKDLQAEQHCWPGIGSTNPSSHDLSDAQAELPPPSLELNADDRALSRSCHTEQAWNQPTSNTSDNISQQPSGHNSSPERSSLPPANASTCFGWNWGEQHDARPDEAGEVSEDDLPLSSRLDDGGMGEDDNDHDGEISEDDVPLSAILRKTPVGKTQTTQTVPRSSAKASLVKAPTTLHPPLHISFREGLPLNIPGQAPRTFASAEDYARHFTETLTCEMQLRLSDLAACWRTAGVDSLPPEVVLVCNGASVGAARDGTRSTAVLIFGQKASVVRGTLKACSRHDLWVVLLPGVQEPLLLRSLWRGITPKGRMLCSAANIETLSWLDSQTKLGSNQLFMATAIACGAFAAEFPQLDILGSVGRQEETPKLDPMHLFGVLPSNVPRNMTPSQTALVQSSELTGLSSEQQNVASHVAALVQPSVSNASGAVLVRGVFGSGKTRTLAACIILLDRLLSAKKDPRRILLVCQTNVAVDAVLQQLVSCYQWDNFARLGSFRSVHPQYPQLLHRTVSLMSTRQSAVRELLEALERRPPEVREALQAAVERGVLPPRSSVWRRHRLLATTTAALDSATHLAANLLQCPFGLVDEVSQLTEPTVFSSFQRAGVQQALLVGDPKQLPPRVVHMPLQRSLLERLWDDGPASARLELATQYRCHPAIAELGNQLFYGGWLRSGISAEGRSSVLGSNMPPLMVLLSQGLETRVGGSYRHDSEADVCAAWLRRAVAGSALRPEHLGVICFYRPHAERCSQAALRHGLAGVECATVDAFQGGERDVVLLSCGRSSFASGRDAFAGCPRRLNVALSRARRHLVIFGSECFLSQHAILSHVLAAAHTKGSVWRASEVLGTSR